MTKAPLVSIIIPCYNYGHFLGETLKNIQEQSYTNWECIIVDDGSVDNTLSVSEQFVQNDSRFRYIYQSNRGLSAARNTGLKNSKGQFIQLLDADDLIAGLKLELQVEKLVSDPKVDLVYGDVLYFNNNDKAEVSISLDFKNTEWMPRISGAGNEIVLALIIGNIMVVSAPLFRASILKDVGYFDEEMKAMEDWDFWLRCALKGKFFLYDHQEGMSTFIRVHKTSMSQEKNRMEAAHIFFRKKLGKIIYNKKYNEVNRRELLYFYGQPAFENIYKNNIIDGAKQLFYLSLKNQEPILFFKWGLAWIFRRFKKRMNSRSLSVL